MESPFETRLYRVTTGTTYDPPKRVRAETRKEAAEIVANRIAKRWYGRAGYCHHVRYDCRTMDRKTEHYEAFVGHTVGNGCDGRHIWVYVS
jgi:hypothetical protein